MLTARFGEAQTESDGTLPDSVLDTEENHVSLEKEEAKKRGFTVTEKNYCAYKFCPWAADNKKQKCGADSKGTQEGRARAPCFCIHSKCLKGYHPTCHALAHKLIS